MKQTLKRVVRGAVDPVGRGLARVGFSANLVTATGLLFAGVAAYGFVRGDRWMAFLFLLLSGLSDLLDGAVARANSVRGTKFGAAFDSTLDRYGEGLVLGAILVSLAQRGATDWMLGLALLAGIGSFLVSYVRARSEGLGIPCEVGILERPERLVLLLVLALWGHPGEPWILGALALLTHVTFLQRLIHIHRATTTRGGAVPAQNGEKTRERVG
ncbi:MAG: CDP-alcohol phosphatidyltransferase family protein [Candidatus Eisenbacteria bacterium]|uniref:CDP-alcohol phosphatidyltransferase family protein n=1 Tax=Eiseniibacteriota bacterium TaxID=2212470 RepID=A0A956LZM3_UNCEI|nr:CDP-alcohol phosphatidyltransferase family protein [Candidatus Eisenbacteria bacterium]